MQLFCLLVCRSPELLQGYMKCLQTDSAAAAAAAQSAPCVRPSLFAIQIFIIFLKSLFFQTEK